MKGAVVKNTLAFVLLLSILFVRPALAADEGQTVGLFRNDPGAFQGYTLFTPRHYNTTYLIDMEGRLVHSFATPHDSVFSLAPKSHHTTARSRR